ncbi:MAG TPA: hypothetical protein VME19_02730 [Streptosporangiaceae bacterium]|nr:hypothetical protein [Streptosporangiaceae bacterium]
MIRRGFWLTVGAVTGIAGYRRVSAVRRRVSGRLTRGGAPRLDGPSLDRHRLAGPGLAVQAIRFARDVREGMDLYMARHSPPEGPTLGARDLPSVRGRSAFTHHDPRPKDGY